MYSYHIFYFPFKWEIPEWKSKLFSEQTNLDNIPFEQQSNWLHNPEGKTDAEKNELYNEKNYFYEFVHPVLYDCGKKGSIIKHFERKEPQEKKVFYIISKRNGKTYNLKVDAINLNLYTTGVGMLTFFLSNEKESQQSKEDILTINQYGRRIFPPFFDDINEKIETAEYLAIEGLNGDTSLYREDFSSYNHQNTWQPACFIKNLIADLSKKLVITPIIDDRMFVNCWYANNSITEKFYKKDQADFNKFIETDNFIYKYIFVDVSSETCQNEEMRKNILNKQIYERWQKDGTLFGISRYSFMALTNTNEFYGNFLLKVHIRTIYSRMIELILVQRASILKFSGEITQVSCLSKGNKIDKIIMKRISSLYKEYIRFINQIHFREVTIQDQGIELYDLISKMLKTEKYIDDLDREIDELNQYVNLLDDKIRNKNAERLNIIAGILLPSTFFTGIFCMIPDDLFPLKIKLIIVCGIPLLIALAIGIIKWIKCRINF